jgi:transcriptional regulator of arginine metabolism
MDKNSRHQAIKEIVAVRPITRQDDLVRALTERGFKVTQATVSRDIAEIPLHKVRTAQGLVYHWHGPLTEPTSRLSRMMREFALSVSRSGNILVVKTAGGAASTVAGSLDDAGLAPVLGTIAGDDTIMVVAKDGQAGRDLHDVLVNMLS